MFYDRLEAFLGQDKSPTKALEVGPWIQRLCYGRSQRYAQKTAQSLSTVILGHRLNVGSQDIFEDARDVLDLYFEDDLIDTTLVFDALQEHFGGLQGYWNRHTRWVWHHNTVYGCPKTLPTPPYWQAWSGPLHIASTYHEKLQPGAVSVEDYQRWKAICSFQASDTLFRQDGHLMSFHAFAPRQRLVLARFI